jgi:hypothetical protein
MKGLDYKERVEKRRQEKEKDELQGCTFIPKIKTKVRPKNYSGQAKKESPQGKADDNP